MTLTCRAVRLQLPLVDPDKGLAEPLASHVSLCLACQAESARYNRLLRTLAGIADHIEGAPPGFAAGVEARLMRGDSGAVTASVRLARMAAAAGAVFAAAGTVAMVRWMRARSAA